MRILGANSMYDIVKFNTETDKKTIALKSASQPASVGETVYLLPYSTQKAATCQTGTVTKVDTIGDKAYYYTLAMTTNEKTVSCPIMNANGEVLGLIQKNASDEAKESYAIGATYGASLSITALSLNDMSLNKIGIKKGLPETEDQALVYLFMASSQQNQDEYITTLNDFLEQYPNSADGYIPVSYTHLAFLAEYSSFNKNVDFAGRIVYDDKGVEVFNFGKYKGMSVSEVLQKDPGYYSWILNGDFTLNTKNVLTKIRLRESGMMK